MNKFRYFNFSLCRESPLQVAGDFPCVGKVPCELQETFPVQGKSHAGLHEVKLPLYKDKIPFIYIVLLYCAGKGNETF